MARWTGIVLALPPSRPDGMVSRLPAFLHPIAGRPLIWHAIASLAESTIPPERVLVLSQGDLADDLFQDLAIPVTVLSVPDAESRPRAALHPLEAGEQCVVLHAAALARGPSLAALLESPPGSWIAGGRDHASAVRSDPEHLPQLLRLPEPLVVPNGALAVSDRLEAPRPVPVVADREQLAAAAEQVRARLVRALMGGGVTFLLPDSVLVDVDVRVGRDSVVYPGVVLEGATTVGEETVIGPGCRIIDSWVGSGVELKGWNYISHTSVRNRAILEPYVRRGFD